MNLRSWITLILAAGLTLAAAGYCAQWRSSIRAGAIAAERQIAIDSLKREVADRIADKAQADSVAARLERELAEREATTHREIERANRRASEAERILRGAVSDTLVPVLDSLVAERDRVERGLRTVIGLRDRKIDDLTARLALSEQLNDQFAEVVERQEGQIELWRRQARPGLFVQAGRELPKLLGVAAVGFVLGSVISN